jgi:hypothetical protein
LTSSFSQNEPGVSLADTEKWSGSSLPGTGVHPRRLVGILRGMFPGQVPAFSWEQTSCRKPEQAEYGSRVPLAWAVHKPGKVEWASLYGAEE